MESKAMFDQLFKYGVTLLNENEHFYEEIYNGYYTPITNPIVDYIRLLGRRIQGHLLLLPIIHEIANDKQALTMDDLFFDEWEAITPDGRNLHNIKKHVESTYKVKLNRDLVFPKPWNGSRLRDNLIKIGEGGLEGNWRQDGNHNLVLWLPMGISFVESHGHHSITAGIVKGEGEVVPDNVYDISPVFEYVYTDGINYYRKHDNRVISVVRSVECAVIFELGRLMQQRNVFLQKT
ncbi:DUF6710 family protein [Paenibacillus sp. HB172176]|uniref:DUF6710 family protein n=1 Tax=Paenibacillus sp. HB172176 TaxID=2493690 RepID=UPI00143A2C4E|nr:DUF6710 family protein [Paenibacillus sp. HB172176]